MTRERFDGVTIYELTPAQLQKLRLSRPDLEEDINRLLNINFKADLKAAKTKRQVDPDFGRNNF